MAQGDHQEKSLHSFIQELGEEIEDPDEEHFILFSTKPSNHDLGFVDRQASEIDISVGAHSFSIQQSPALLRSERQAGTTGAVVWKVTPLVCKWLAHPGNPLSAVITTKNATILELGSGVSGLLGLTLGPRVRKFIASDQEYCLKLLNKNITENLGNNNNTHEPKPPSSSKGRAKQTKAFGKGHVNSMSNNSSTGTWKADVSVITLDWEEHVVAQHPELRDKTFDAVFACDCIYNESLIQPFISTIASACKVNQAAGSSALAIVAQELRSPDVLQAFLAAFHDAFHIWRVPDEMFEGMDVQELLNGGGFCVHVGVLREV